MDNACNSYRFLSKQTIDHLLGKVSIDTENGLGRCVLDQCHGLLRLIVERLRYPSRIEDDLYGADGNSAN